MSAASPWDVMVDLFFYREPEETKEDAPQDDTHAPGVYNEPAFPAPDQSRPLLNTESTLMYRPTYANSTVWSGHCSQHALHIAFHPCQHRLACCVSEPDGSVHLECGAWSLSWGLLSHPHSCPALPLVSKQSSWLIHACPDGSRTSKAHTDVTPRHVRLCKYDPDFVGLISALVART